jgi:hypothetical protein
MKKIIHFSSLMLLLLLLFAAVNGYAVTRAIIVSYLPGPADNGWLKGIAAKNSAPYHPTIAVNLFSDERENGAIEGEIDRNTEANTVGAVYNRAGKKVETLVTDESPADIIEKALIRQLEKDGFIIIRTAGWNLDPGAAPTYLNADFILGGRVKAFWIESRARVITSVIDSKVAYDLTLVDLHNQKVICAEQFTGNDTQKSLAHAGDYFLLDLQTSISNSLTKAIDNAFQKE